MEPRVFSSEGFCRFGQSLANHSPAVQVAAAGRLERVLGCSLEEAGQWIVLRSPHTGYGKTHLLTRMQQHLRGSHGFVPLVIDPDGALDLEQLWRVIEDRSGRPSPEFAPLTGFDLLARRLLARGLEPLVTSGVVPTRDSAATVDSLKKRPLETFDFRDSQAVIARWTREHAAELLPRIAAALSDEAGTGYGATLRWLHALFEYANATGDELHRLEGLSVRSLEVATLLGLLGLLQRVVLVFDDADVAHYQPFAARRLIHACARIRQAAPRADVVIAMNHDTWATAFERGLGEAAMDRIQSCLIDLQPLTRAEVAALLHLDARADEIDAMMADLGDILLTPRRVLSWMHEHEKVVKNEEPVTVLESDGGVFAPLD